MWQEEVREMQASGKVTIDDYGLAMDAPNYFAFCECPKKHIIGVVRGMKYYLTDISPVQLMFPGIRRTRAIARDSIPSRLTNHSYMARYREGKSGKSIDTHASKFWHIVVTRKSAKFRQIHICFENRCIDPKVRCFDSSF